MGTIHYLDEHRSTSPDQLDAVLTWARNRDQIMSASELLYFHGAPYAHIVAWEDHQRMLRARAQIDMHRRAGRDRRFGSRAYTFR